MKFFSKSTNLHIILRPGLQAQPLTGTPARPTLSVRFHDGMADVVDEELVKMMLAHPGFESDFISVDEEKSDPFKFLRQEQEPTHIHTELKYGTPQKSTSSKTQPQLPPEIAKLIQDQAISIAKQMLPDMVKETIKTMSLLNSNTHTQPAYNEVDKGLTSENSSSENPINIPPAIVSNTTEDAPIVSETTGSESDKKTKVATKAQVGGLKNK